MSLIIIAMYVSACTDTNKTGGDQADSGKTNVGSSGTTGNTSVASSGFPMQSGTRATDTGANGKSTVRPRVDTLKTNPK